MQFLPVKTRILQPPQDDLFAVLDEYLTDVQDGDVALITSKVVAINEGRSVLQKGTDKATLVRDEAEQIIEEPGHNFALTIKHHTILPSSGIDESNSGDYFTLLPEQPFKSAQEIWEYLREKHSVKNIGVIITESHLLPMRGGVVSTAIGFWGLNPIEDHKGKTDLFGRKMGVSSTNIVDALAAGSGLVAGETDACTPVVIARDVSRIVFVEEDMQASFVYPPTEDLYYPLLKKFYE